MSTRARILALVGRELTGMEADGLADADRLLTLAKIAAVAEGLDAGTPEEPEGNDDELEAALSGGLLPKR